MPWKSLTTRLWLWLLTPVWTSPPSPDLSPLLYWISVTLINLLVYRYDKSHPSVQEASFALTGLQLLGQRTLSFVIWNAFLSDKFFSPLWWLVWKFLSQVQVMLSTSATHISVLWTAPPIWISLLMLVTLLPTRMLIFITTSWSQHRSMVKN